METVMAFGGGMGINPNQQNASNWVDQTIAQMKGQTPGGGLASSLGSPQSQAADARAKAWVDQTLGQMKGQPVAGTGGFGSMTGGAPDLSALGANYGGASLGLDPTRSMTNMIGSAGLGPAQVGANPLAGLV